MENDINILDYCRVIRKRWFLLFLFCAGSGAAGIYKGFNSPQIYRAETELYVFTSGGNRMLSQIPQPLLGLSGISEGIGSQSDYLEKLLNSDSLALAVAKKLELGRIRASSVKEKKKNSAKSEENKNGKNKKPDRQRLISRVKPLVTVKNDKKGGITITCESQSRRLAALIANTYVEVLRSKMTSKEEKNVNFLKKQLEKVKNDLTTAEDKLKQFQEENKVMVLEKQLDAEVNEYLGMKSEQVKNKMSLEATRKLIQSSGSLEDLARLEGQKILYETKLSELDETLQKMDANLLLYPGKSQQFARLLREAKLQGMLFELFSQQYEMGKISQLKEDVDFQVIDKAFPPQEPIKPQKRKILMISLVAGFFAGMSFIFLIEYVQNVKIAQLKT